MVFTKTAWIWTITTTVCAAAVAATAVTIMVLNNKTDDITPEPPLPPASQFVKINSSLTPSAKTVYGDDGETVYTTSLLCVDVADIPNPENSKYFEITDQINFPILIPTDFNIYLRCAAGGSINITSSDGYHGSGIYIGNDVALPATSSNIRIMNNIIHSSLGDGIEFLNSVTGSVQIANNAISSTPSGTSEAIGIHFNWFDACPVNIHDNIITATAPTGKTAYGINLHDNYSDPTLITNNTISCTSSGADDGYSKAIYFNGTAWHPLNIINNTISSVSALGAYGIQTVGTIKCNGPSITDNYVSAITTSTTGSDSFDLCIDTFDRNVGGALFQQNFFYSSCASTTKTAYGFYCKSTTYGVHCNSLNKDDFYWDGTTAKSFYDASGRLSPDTFFKGGLAGSGQKDSTTTQSTIDTSFFVSYPDITAMNGVMALRLLTYKYANTFSALLVSDMVTQLNL